MVISGALIVDDVSSGDFSVSDENVVTADFRKVEYKDVNGTSLGNSYYLNGTTYSDKSGITKDKCVYTEDGAGNKTAVPTTITSDTTVICADHELDETGTCTVCGAEYGIDLTKLKDYESAGNILDGKVSVRIITSDEQGRYLGSYYRIDIKKSGTYLLTGDNIINGSYVDVNIRIGDNVDANIICDAYIKNVIMKDFALSGEADITHGYVNVFQTTNTNSTLNLSGNLAIERTYCNSHDTFSDYLGGNTSSITADFFEVTYTDADSNSLGKTAYLSGGTYSDKSGVTEGKCTYTMNGTEKVPFDPTNITGAADVICADHTFDENGACTFCGAKYEIDLSKLAEYEASSDPIFDGKIRVEAYSSMSGSPQYRVYFKESGSYIIKKGSNYINDCYCDVRFYSSNSADVTLVFDDVYIRNDDGTHDVDTSGYVSHSDGLTPFIIGSGTLTLTGKLAVDTYCCVEGDYTGSFKTDGVTADYFEVTYKDESDKVIGKSFYLNGSTYSDKSEVPSQYPCVTSNGAVFDYTDIKAAATVNCSEHSIDENGVCSNCSQNVLIDLSRLSDYLSDTSALPDGVTINRPDNFDDIVEITITKSGNYMLKGKNYCNGAYFDVKFNIENNADVTFECNDVFIKNDNVGCMKNTEQYVPTFPEGVTVNNVYSYNDNMDYSGNYTAFNYVTPFDITDGATLTLSGKLFVDTAHAVAEDGKSFDLPVNEGGGYLATGFSNVDYCDSDNNQELFDRNYCLSGANYIATDYIDSKYHCVQVNSNDPGDYSFNGYTDIYLALHHHIPENSNTCDYCGMMFGAVYTVTVDDTFNTPTTYRVAENDTFDRPDDPVAPVGQKLEGWYVDETTKYVFGDEVISDITLTAHYEDSLVKSVELAPASNVVNTYIEGNKFDPTGLVIIVTFEDDRTDTITYSAENTRFMFSPTLTRKLTQSDDSVRVYYGTAMQGGSNYVDIPITVAAKQLYSIAVKTAPTKVKYVEGTPFDPTGLVITLTYDNGDTEDVEYTTATAGKFSFDKEVLTLGDTTVTITYGNKTDTQTVTVVEKSLDRIAVKTAPTKVRYVEGTPFDPTGLVITLTYDNGDTEDVEYTTATAGKFSFDKDVLALGDNSVTITYGGKTDTQTVTVVEKSLDSIAVKTAPTKVKYVEGTPFDPTGLVITLTYDNGDTEDVEYTTATAGKFSFSKGVFALGDNSVTITYGGKTDTQTVTVVEKSLDKIEVKTAPTKVKYVEGTPFDPTGLVITLTYDNGDTEDVEYTTATAGKFSFDK
ncbi:MAG: bacterial Ig-like domain-containing protein, partial [Oscillospiraceae bacterium]